MSIFSIGRLLFLGPKVHHWYSNVNGLRRTELYRPNIFERLGDSALQARSMCLSLLSFVLSPFGLLVVSPLLIHTFYKRRHLFTKYNGLRLTWFIICFHLFCYTLRALGRLTNPEYRRFSQLLANYNANPTEDAQKKISLYDFDDFNNHYPVDYEWSGDEKSLLTLTDPPRSTNVFMDGLAFCVYNPLARWLLFPGSTALINALVAERLRTGRASLVQEMSGTRAKLRSYLNDTVDTMFVDKRGAAENGPILVISCEGNGGFYEIGSGLPFSQAGYSVLAWNYPGFGHSFGSTTPKSIEAAAAVVMEYATEQLKFDYEHIVIYGWSIGGFAATWFAMNYPKVKGLYLDATFDQVLPLATSHFNIPFLLPLIEKTIERHANLDVSRQLSHYLGPVRIIRRVRDEIICTVSTSNEERFLTNRANDLIKQMVLARHRHTIPESLFMPVADEFLAIRMPEDKQKFAQELGVNVDQNIDDLIDRDHSGDITDHSLRRLSVYLLMQYLQDIELTHNEPLPQTALKIPTDVYEI